MKLICISVCLSRIAIILSTGSSKNFNKQLEGLNTEEERAQLIQQTLNGIYGETANKYKEVNAGVIEGNKAQNEYNQAMAQLGEKVQPIITEFKLAMVGVLQSILEKFNEVDIKGIINGIANALSTTMQWIIDNKGTILAFILGVGSAFLTWKVGSMIMTVVNAIKVLTTTTKGMTLAQTLLNAVMKANPIGLVATAVGVLITAFTLLWQNCEGFRNFFTGMWDGFVGVVKGAVNGIIGFLNTLIKAINLVGDGLGFISGGALHFEIGKIPYLAKGGVVDRPTLAMIGEAGKEAVMPLENNTGWINELADKLASKMQPSQATTTNNFN